MPRGWELFLLLLALPPNSGLLARRHWEECIQWTSRGKSLPGIFCLFINSTSTLPSLSFKSPSFGTSSGLVASSSTLQLYIALRRYKDVGYCRTQSSWGKLSFATQINILLTPYFSPSMDSQFCLTSTSDRSVQIAETTPRISSKNIQREIW
jgi:hypothetical protein